MSAEVRARIAHAVTAFRIERGWDQATLAERASVSLEMLQRIEAGTDPCRIDTLTDLAEALGVPVERLVEPRDENTH